MRQLEAELGTPLFTRTTRNVSLTAAGEFLYGETTRVLDAVEDSVRGVRRLTDGRGGLLRVGYTGTAAYTQLPRVARLLKAELPDVAVEIHADLLTPAQSDLLREGRIDIGVLRPPVAGDELELRTIVEERLLVALPADHKLVDEPVIEMGDLRSEVFVMYADSHSAVNDAVLRSCRAAGFAPDCGHEAPGTAVLLALVSAGLGIALVPEAVRAAPLDGVVFREVPDAETTELAIAWRRGNTSPLVSRVLETLSLHGYFAPSSGPGHQLVRDVEVIG